MPTTNEHTESVTMHFGVCQLRKVDIFAEIYPSYKVPIRSSSIMHQNACLLFLLMRWQNVKGRNGWNVIRFNFAAKMSVALTSSSSSQVDFSSLWQSSFTPNERWRDDLSQNSALSDDWFFLPSRIDDFCCCCCCCCCYNYKFCANGQLCSKCLEMAR